MNIQACDIILVHTKPPYGFSDLPAPIIRKVTKCYYNHVAIVTEYLGELWITEAVAKGFVVTTPLKEYLEKVGKKREIAVLRPCIERPIQDVYKNLRDIINKGYDIKSLGWYQLWYQITGKWKGKTGDGAEKSVYCSEAVAEGFPDIFPEPWLVSPDKMFAEKKLNIIFESNFEERKTFDKKYRNK